MNFPSALLVTDTTRIDAIAAASCLPPGSGVILRDYHLSDEKRLELGKALKKICSSKKIPLLVARDAWLALELDADGMHFPEFAYAEMRRWRAKKPGWLITAAAHSRYAARNAHINGADAILVSPVFPTDSDAKKHPLGIRRAATHIYSGYPAYALGGVLSGHLPALKAAGFLGFAGVSWVKTCGYSATVGCPNPIKQQKFDY